MKRNVLKVLGLSLAFGLSACGSNVIFVGRVSSNYDGNINSSHSTFDGTCYYDISLKKDTAINVSFKVEDGKFTCDVSNKDTNESIYSGNIEENMDFVINAPKGDYKITLTGKNHKGSYSFTWDK